MKDYIYIVQDGSTIQGFITKEEFERLEKEGKIELHMDNEDWPMVYDEVKEIYFSLSKAYKIPKLDV